MSAHHRSPPPPERARDNVTRRIAQRIEELSALHQSAQALQDDARPADERMAKVLAEEQRIIDSLPGLLEGAESEIESYQRQLRSLASKLLLAEEQGRRDIASELHDHLGQALAFVRMKTVRFGSNAVFCGFEHDIAQIVALLDQTIQYTRTLTCEISPPVLYELGLAPALEWLAEDFRRKHELAVVARVEGDYRALSDKLRIMVFQSVRELLTNAAKHARAAHVGVDIVCGSESVVVEVSDDGVGFDLEAVAVGVGSHDGFGLFSIRERVAHLGGRAEIVAEPGAGTRVRLEVPSHVGGSQ